MTQFGMTPYTPGQVYYAPVAAPDFMQMLPQIMNLIILVMVMVMMMRMVARVMPRE